MSLYDPKPAHATDVVETLYFKKYAQRCVHECEDAIAEFNLKPIGIAITMVFERPSDDATVTVLKACAKPGSEAALIKSLETQLAHARAEVAGAADGLFDDPEVTP